MKLVRLYPRDPERGWFIQTYVDPQLGLKFVASQGWYQVDDDVAEVLSVVRQKHYDPRSAKAFLIAANADEARKLEVELRPPKKEGDIIGTADAPVPVLKSTRPGSRVSAPKSRKRSMTAG